MNTKKTKQLGMPFGTACHRLRKIILFQLLVKHNENICFRCNLPVESVDELSMEHKIAWLDGDTSLFWDPENVTFSHLSCNGKHRRYNKPGPMVHGKTYTYRKFGCRCQPCSLAGSVYRKKWRADKKALS